MTALRSTAKRLLPALNHLAERAHVRVEPLHYYSNIADRRWLRRNGPVWQKPFPAWGIDWDLDKQVEWLRTMVTPYVREVEGLEAFRVATKSSFGPGYGPIESQVLHCVVRAIAPRHIVEVGSGVSTFLARQASERNSVDGRTRSAITCIEPFPRSALQALHDVEIHAMGCQEAPRELFDRLQRGDLLFIDSTHAVRTGSELPFLYLDVLPSLPPGVVVHVHDIYLPYLFNPWIIDDIFDWQESVLLAALLTHNPHLAVKSCLSALHHLRTDALAELLPDYRPVVTHDGLADGPLGDRHFPSSIWLETA